MDVLEAKCSMFKHLAISIGKYSHSIASNQIILAHANYKEERQCIVGCGIPPRHVLGLKAQFLTKSIIKNPQIEGVEREVIIES